MMIEGIKNKAVIQEEGNERGLEWVINDDRSLDLYQEGR
jgi:hypothetical protein